MVSRFTWTRIRMWYVFEAHAHTLIPANRSIPISGLDSQEGLVPPTGLCPHVVSTPKPSSPPKPLLFTPNTQPEKTPTPLPSQP